MKNNRAILILGTFDSKADEHLFIKKRLEERNQSVLTINVGTKGPSPFPVNYDLFAEMKTKEDIGPTDRDQAIAAMISKARERVNDLYLQGAISGMISAGGGSGTYICTQIMHTLPLHIPKVMVSTVASRNMANVVGIQNITMMHSVVDLLGVNSFSGKVLDQAAAAIYGMTQAQWGPVFGQKRIALTFFGFITPAAENIKKNLEAANYEVVAFHANGTGGMAMQALAAEGYFHGILDLATHELADALLNGYCGNIGPDRFEPIPGISIPRLIVPGGMDCAVLEFTRDTIPEQYADRKIFYYDFRSAIRLNIEETTFLARQLAEKLNADTDHVHLLIPTRGFSHADAEGRPLYDPVTGRLFIDTLKKHLDDRIDIAEVDCHINESEFANQAALMMDRLVKESEKS
jgi:uncharacterized protein (UPF0261 family)